MFNYCMFCFRRQVSKVLPRNLNSNYFDYFVFYVFSAQFSFIRFFLPFFFKFPHVISFFFQKIKNLFLLFPIQFFPKRSSSGYFMYSFRKRVRIKFFWMGVSSRCSPPICFASFLECFRNSCHCCLCKSGFWFFQTGCLIETHCNCFIGNQSNLSLSFIDGFHSFSSKRCIVRVLL